MNHLNKIEFKVWDTKLRKFISWNSLPSINFDDDNYVFCQYTGLNTNSGKKIYDGDILNTKPTRWLVFRADDGCWKIKSIQGLHVGRIRYLNNILEDFVIIIGNINENPEQLNDSIGNDNVFDLTNVCYPDITVLMGEDTGKEIRKQWNLDKIDTEHRRTVIIFPEKTLSVNLSFFKGLFKDSILFLGDAFETIYFFECSPNLREDINNGIRDIMRKVK